ncbi:MAG: hypothetical protein QOK11_856 [Pseudonocardiales bacterium]|nr:hypothetical protein [Pseudonocardiales bacterium]
MGSHVIDCGADRFIVRDDRHAVVVSGVLLARAYELVHDGCHFCQAGESNTNDAARGSTRGRNPWC